MAIKDKTPQDEAQPPKVKEKMGRKPLDLDEKKIYELASQFCTTHEIAAKLDCSPDTLERRYAALIKKGRENACQSLRSKQFFMAVEQNNVVMQIWLGKQYLGQKDQKHIDQNQTHDIKLSSEEQQRELDKLRSQLGLSRERDAFKQIQEGQEPKKEHTG